MRLIPEPTSRVVRASYIDSHETRGGAAATPDAIEIDERFQRVYIN